MRYLAGVALILSVAALPLYAQESQCGAVYENATRAYSLDQKRDTELQYFASLHCERNGEIRESSFSGEMGLTIKQIPFSFSADLSDDRQRMQQFCKSMSERNFSDQQSSSYRNTVVVDALRSFNQCVALERSGLVIRHDDQHPYSLIIYGEYKDRTTTAFLDTVVYDPSKVSCSSTNLSRGNTAVAVDTSRRYEIPENFNITCTRTGTQADGATHFERATVAISTSLGPYSVVLQADQLNGFDLASQARETLNTIISERDAALSRASAAESRASSLSSRLENAGIVSWHQFGTGEYDRGTRFRPRHYCGHDVNAEARRLCGDATPLVRLLDDRSGDKCGYADYVVACLRK
jgi:hypothetical protein